MSGINTWRAFTGLSIRDRKLIVDRLDKRLRRYTASFNNSYRISYKNYGGKISITGYRPIEARVQTYPDGKRVECVINQPSFYLGYSQRLLFSAVIDMPVYSEPIAITVTKYLLNRQGGRITRDIPLYEVEDPELLELNFRYRVTDNEVAVTEEDFNSVITHLIATLVDPLTYDSNARVINCMLGFTLLPQTEYLNCLTTN